MKKWFLVTLMLLYNTYSSQFSEQKNKIFDSLVNQELINTNDIIANGNILLKIAQDDLQKARAYNIIGDGLYKSGKFNEAIKFLELSEKITKNASEKSFVQDGKELLFRCYLNVGLLQKAKQQLKELEEIYSEANYNPENLSILQGKAKLLEYEGKFCEAIDYRQKTFNLAENTPQPKDPYLQDKFRIYARILLCYPLIKCGRISEAEHRLNETQQLITKLGKEYSNYLIELYYLERAILSYQSKETKVKTIKWFDLAYNAGLKTESEPIMKVIIEERLLTKVDTPEKQLQLTNHLLKINKNLTLSTSNVSSNELVKTETQLSTQTKEKKVLTIASIIAILVISTLLLYYKLNNANKFKQFKKIIAELENPKENKIPTIISDSQTGLLKEDIIKNDETEKKIINRLEKFEKEKGFNTKGISTAQMAVFLKTNTKYVNYILKKHRNSDFYNYINDSRINYITRALKEEPKLRQYKISAIADICGYASHSQFASVFKSKKGISPSQYIELLVSENKH